MNEGKRRGQDQTVIKVHVPSRMRRPVGERGGVVEGSSRPLCPDMMPDKPRLKAVSLADFRITVTARHARIQMPQQLVHIYYMTD